MADEIISNLEPIDEGDLSLEKKFVGEKPGEEAIIEAKIESIHTIEAPIERQEGAAEKESAYSKILSKIGSGKIAVATDEVDVTEDAKTVASGIDAESKITNLVQLAETKGIPHAVKVARHMEDNYSLDEFHDRLLGEQLHDALLKSGMIKEI